MNAHDRVRLADMLDMALRAQRLIAGKTRESLEQDDMLLGLAIIRAVEVIGEAAANTSAETQSPYVDLPWKQMIGMRNYLIHRYARVDLNVVWDTATQSLSLLVPQLEQILSETAG